MRDPVALAIRLVRRGLECPDVRCEDGHQLDLNAPCKACALTAVERTSARAPEPDQPHIDPVPSRPSRGTDLRRTRANWPDSDAPAGATRDSTATAAIALTPVDVHAHAARARALLKARATGRTRAVLVTRQTSARSA